jgi:hypothetical protein
MVRHGNLLISWPVALNPALAYEFRWIAIQAGSRLTKDRVSLFERSARLQECAKRLQYRPAIFYYRIGADHEGVLARLLQSLPYPAQHAQAIAVVTQRVLDCSGNKAAGRSSLLKCFVVHRDHAFKVAAGSLINCCRFSDQEHDVNIPSIQDPVSKRKLVV